MKIKQYDVKVDGEYVGFVEGPSCIVYREDGRKPSGELTSNGAIGHLRGDKVKGFTLNGKEAKVSFSPIYESL
jgi:hypothetical protein